MHDRKDFDYTEGDFENSQSNLTAEAAVLSSRKGFDMFASRVQHRTQ